MSATKRPSQVAVDSLRRGAGTTRTGPVSEAEAAAIIEGATPAQVRIREALKPPRPPKPIRVTLDLDDARHGFLKDFGAGVSSAQVLRALLDELQADPDLAARVRARIWADRR